MDELTLEQARAILELDRVILAAEDPQTIIQTVLDRIGRIIPPCDRASITLVDRDRGGMLLYAGADLTGGHDLQPGRFIPGEDTTTSRAVESKREEYRPDLAAEAALTAIDRELLRWGIRADLVVPMLVGEDALGTLNLGSRQVDAFTPSHAHVAQELAQRAAIAIRRVQTLATSQREVTDLAALLNVARAALGKSDLEALLSDLTTAVADLLDAESCVLLYRDEQTGDFAPYPPAFGLSERELALLHFDAETAERLLSQWPDRLVLISSEPAADPRLRTDVAEELGERSLLLARLRVEDHLLGVLRVANKRGGSGFTSHDAQLLELAASPIAAAMNNARLHRQVEQERARLRREVEAFAAISRHVGTADTPTGILWEALSHLLTILGIDGTAAIYQEPDGRFVFFSVPQMEAVNNDFSPEELGRVRRQAYAQVLARFRQDPSPLLIPDTEQHASPLVQAACKYGGRSLLVCPMGEGDQITGVLVLGTIKAHHPFTEQDVALAAALARYLGQTLENQWLYRESLAREAKLRRRQRELRTLFQVTHTINVASEPTDMVRETLQRVLDLLDIHSGWVSLRDPGTGTFYPAFTINLPPILQAEGALEGDCWCRRLAEVDGIHRALNTVECERIAKLTDHLEREEVYHTVIPILWQDNVLGLMNVATREWKALSEENLSLLTAVGQQLGVGLRRAQLYSEMKLAAGELARANEELRRLDRIRTELLANVSHELKTPLIPISSLAQLMLGGKAGSLTDEQRDFLQAMVRSAERLQRFSDQLLGTVRRDQGRERLQPARLDLRQVLRESADTIAPAVEAKHLHFDLRLPDEPLWVQGDGSMLRQVFDNLLSNATKFTPAGGRVTLAAWSAGDKVRGRQGAGERGAKANDQCSMVDGQWSTNGAAPDLERQDRKSKTENPRSVIVEVIDTGVGIAEEEQPRVFDRFYQATGKGYTGGTGLGLAIVKELVELHGGSVSVQSAPGRGSKFTVCLAGE